MRGSRADREIHFTEVALAGIHIKRYRKRDVQRPLLRNPRDPLPASPKFKIRIGVGKYASPIEFGEGSEGGGGKAGGTTRRPLVLQWTGGVFYSRERRETRFQKEPPC